MRQPRSGCVDRVGARSARGAGAAPRLGGTRWSHARRGAAVYLGLSGSEAALEEALLGASRAERSGLRAPGPCSRVYRAPYAAQARCRDPPPHWTEFPHRILNVVFVGRSWVLGLGCDFSDDELLYLRAHVRVWPHQRRAEASEQLSEEHGQPRLLGGAQVDGAPRGEQVSQGKDRLARSQADLPVPRPR
ncbi:mitochondrial import inner membrane translocase subunit Tim29-like [Saccopteryx bilineata]|uniref:mitochondrial import inner membrane translocase subunit Tim29-like n=1 Tax=Saccopteryx bilineata TaxID=59482 RepID=UPI00338E462D